MHILLIEDDSLILNSIQSSLPSAAKVSHFDSLVKVDFSSLDQHIDLALVDLMSPSDPTGEKSIELISEFRRLHPDTVLVVQSGVDDIAVMRKAIKQGANRFVLKEHILSELPFVLEWVGEISENRSRVDALIKGESQAIRDFKQKLVRAIPAKDDVLIEGESGVGKELCAIAFGSGGIPFISVNIASIPKDIFEGELFGYEKGAFSGATAAKAGLLEAAEDGILFLDEIQSLNIDLQVKLLRVLENRTFRRLGSTQERHFKGRILSASNRPLVDLVLNSNFREDLYFRLSAISIKIPPLRMRDGDVPLLAQSFLSEFDTRSEKSIEADALASLENYDWPGNVRQLRACIKNAVLNASIPKIGKEEIEEYFTAWEKVSVPSGAAGDFQIDWSQGLDQNVKDLEKFMISQAIEKHGSVKARDVLQVKKSRFYEKLKTLEIADTKKATD
ncbi:sigma-54-dependent Fis family transcriptional regulator [bacterium]|nr:sigma-54-dependent Fis family transcriptional regulator [bacterium]